MNAHLFESLSFIWNFKLDEREKMDNDWNWIFQFINNSKYIWINFYKIRNDTNDLFRNVVMNHYQAIEINDLGGKKFY